MTRSRWTAILVVAALAAGLWYADREGHLDATKSSYRDWAAAQAADKAARDAGGRKPTLWEITKDAVVWLVPAN